MSENIFTEIYNKILSLFGQTGEKEDTKDVAINRLRLVLMQDRTNLTPEILQRMRKELIELLSKYVEMDKDALELNFEQDGEQMALMLSIPVVRAKDEDEIEAAIKAAEDKKEIDSEEKTSDDSKEEEDNEKSEDTNDDSDENTESETLESKESEEKPDESTDEADSDKDEDENTKKSSKTSETDKKEKEKEKEEK